MVFIFYNIRLFIIHDNYHSLIVLCSYSLSPASTAFLSLCMELSLSLISCRLVLIISVVYAVWFYSSDLPLAEKVTVLASCP